MKGTVGGVTITYIGNYYEWSGSTRTSQGRSVCPLIMSKIGFFTNVIIEPEKGSDLPLQRRVGTGSQRQGSTLSYLFVDHASTALSTSLGST
jgi:hypothetical protein